MGNSYSKFLSTGVNIPIGSRLYKSRMEQGKMANTEDSEFHDAGQNNVATNKINNFKTCCTERNQNICETTEKQ